MKSERERVNVYLYVCVCVFMVCVWCLQGVCVVRARCYWIVQSGLHSSLVDWIVIDNPKNRVEQHLVCVCL